MKFIERGSERGAGGQRWLRVGRWLAMWPVHQPVDEAPLVDGGRSTLTTDEVTTWFGGLVFRRPGSDVALFIGKAGARVPNPARWRPRFVLGELRWRLAGRPQPTPMQGVFETAGDRLYLDLVGARERLCRAQTLVGRAGHAVLLQEALDRVDRVGAYLPQWSKYDLPPLDDRHG